MALTPNQRGALYMVLSMAGFTCNDTLSKLASADVGFGQLMLVRGVFASALVGVLAWRGGAFRSRATLMHPLIGVRMLGELFATVFFFQALFNLPIATVSAVLQALPLAVTMGAALVFGERVGWRRWTAIAVGFAGVLIIVRPQAGGTNAYAMWALASVACCAVRDLATSRIPREVPSAFVSFVTAVCVSACGGVIVLAFEGWRPMSAATAGTLAAAACVLVVGYQFIIMAVRAGDISSVAPFRYTALVWAILLGLLVFGDVPDGIMLAGAALVVGSGVYTLYRDRVVGKRTAAKAAADPAMAPDGV